MSGERPFDEGRLEPGAVENPVHRARPDASGPADPVPEDATVLGGLDVPEPISRTAVDRPPAVADLAEFRRSLVDLGLAVERELDAIAAEIPESEGVPGLARVLQQAGLITGYQAAAIHQRKGRGLLIGEYLILDKLGPGGMGMVFKARHRRLGRVVALRILPPSFVRDRDAVPRLRREVLAAGRLEHPNLVAALEVGEDRGVPFLVTEYVDGDDLDHLVRHRGPMTTAQAIDCIIQAARGLEAAHARGIVHRAIRPSNLILDPAGVVRMIPNALGQAAGDFLTRSGTTLDRVNYTAPEQAEDPARADHRADIYSLGCTLDYLLTGREPFTGDTIPERLLAHRDRPAPSLKAARPDVPTPLEDAYRRMVAKIPSERPASMTEVIALLEACRSAAAEVPAPTAAAPRFSATTRRGIKPKPDPTARPAAPYKPEDRHRARRIDLAMQTVAVLVVVGLAGMLVVASRRGASTRPAEPAAGADRVNSEATPKVPVTRMVSRTIFDGKSPVGWMLTNRRPLDARHVQPDGLNPHGTGSYLVVYHEKLGDFVLDFDYRLTRGGNSGVFLRVGNLNDPVNTGIEVELSDSTGPFDRDPGAFLGLVEASRNAYKPGEWNHMTIAADGPRLSVTLNGDVVTTMNLDAWTLPGKRPDGTFHKFQGRVVANLPRSGYLGFQDLKGDCWFRNIVVKAPAPDSSGAPITRSDQ